MFDRKAASDVLQKEAKFSMDFFNPFTFRGSPTVFTVNNVVLSGITVGYLGDENLTLYLNSGNLAASVSYRDLKEFYPGGKRLMGAFEPGHTPGYPLERGIIAGYVLWYSTALNDAPASGVFPDIEAMYSEVDIAKEKARALGARYHEFQFSVYPANMSWDIVGKRLATFGSHPDYNLT